MEDETFGYGNSNCLTNLVLNCLVSVLRNVVTILYSWLAERSTIRNCTEVLRMGFCYENYKPVYSTFAYIASVKSCFSTGTTTACTLGYNLFIFTTCRLKVFENGSFIYGLCCNTFLYFTNFSTIVQDLNMCFRCTPYVIITDRQCHTVHDVVSGEFEQTLIRNLFTGECKDS